MSDNENETYEDDDDDIQPLKPVLPIPSPSSSSFPLTPNTTPVTAEQYLLQVHAEAQALPSVSTAHALGVPSSPTETLSTSFHKVKPFPRAPAHALPHPTWRRQNVDHFKHLQTVLSSRENPHQNKTFITPSESKQWIMLFASQIPTLSFLYRLDFVHTVAALDALVNHAIPNCDVPQIMLNVLTNSQLLLWTFSLLAFLQPPLDPDTSAILHALLGKLSFARSVTKEQDEEIIAALNVLIVILEDHYGQR